jgi:signal transduction histidine kinase
LVSLAIAAGATAAYLAGEYPYGPVFFPLGFAVFVVATSQPIRTSMLAGGAALAVVLVGQLSTVEPSQLYTDGLRAAAFFGWLLVPWAVGTMVQYRREAAIREREEDRSRHAYEERLRIARDVHDVVGHGLAVINMQAGIALHVLEKRPEQAAVALDAIKRTSKEALDDLRATLAVYRREEEESAERRPASGLGQLDGLIAATSEAGLPVDHVVEGEPVDLPATIDLTAYRIVQESLTNVVRHAGPASATVRVRYEPGSVTLEVVDNGRARAGDQARAGGHGIAGMRERAAAVGGSLQAGPRAEGGFAVRARLPVGE